MDQQQPLPATILVSSLTITADYTTTEYQNLLEDKSAVALHPRHPLHVVLKNVLALGASPIASRLHLACANLSSADDSMVYDDLEDFISDDCHLADVSAIRRFFRTLQPILYVCDLDGPRSHNLDGAYRPGMNGASRTVVVSRAAVERLCPLDNDFAGEQPLVSYESVMHVSLLLLHELAGHAFNYDVCSYHEPVLK
jgi:hypothetical protein